MFDFMRPQHKEFPSVPGRCHILPIVIFVYIIFKFKLRFFGEIGGAVRLGLFFMSEEFGIVAKFGLEVDLWQFWVSENIFCL